MPTDNRTIEQKKAAMLDYMMKEIDTFDNTVHDANIDELPFAADVVRLHAKFKKYYKMITT